jgi:hypothetical protein
MSLLALAVVASALVDDGGTAVALDDGSVWLVYDGEWEELGGCDDGEVDELTTDGGALEIRCGDGTAWTWDDGGGWTPADPTATATDPAGLVNTLSVRSWWPSLDLELRLWTPHGDAPTAFEGWVRLRWDL